MATDDALVSDQLRAKRLSEDLLLLTLNRPAKRNALTRPLIELLTQELVRTDSSPIRGIVLAGEGTSFCAGVDLHEFADGSPASGSALIGALQDLCATVRGLPKPVACAIQGHCESHRSLTPSCSNTISALRAHGS